MRLALEQDDRITSSIPAVRRDRLSSLSRKHVEPRQKFLCDLLAISYERRHPHRSEPRADSFSREFLLKGLRVSARRNVTATYLRDLYSFEEQNRGYNREAGLTKAYRLRDSVRAVLDEVYSSPDPLPIEGESVPSALENGFPAAVARDGLFVPAHVPIAESDLREAEDRIRGWMEPDNHEGLLDPHRTGELTLRDALQVIRACRMWHRSFGGFPNLYRLQSHGRLGPRGGTVHLITIPRTIRHLILHRSGLEDFDLVSCHWSILQSLARAAGLETPWVDAYLRHKEEWHRFWAEGTALYPGDLKAITSSWLTGGVLSASPRVSGTRTVGRWVMEFLQKDHRSQSLYQETRETLSQVIPQVMQSIREGSHTVAVNAVGQALVIDGASQGRLYSHALTGFEQFAIRACCRRVRDPQAVVYDGFIAPPQEVGPLEESIREESSGHLGFTLDLRIKRKSFSSPIVDRWACDLDFEPDYLAELMAA